MLAELSTIARFVAEAVKLWHSRARERQVLGEFNDYILRDIGLTRSDARTESARPFWQGNDGRMKLRHGLASPAIGQMSQSWM